MGAGLGDTSGEAPAGGRGPCQGRGARFLWIVTFGAFFITLCVCGKVTIVIGVGGGFGEVVGFFITFWTFLFLFVCVEKLRFWWWDW